MKKDAAKKKSSYIVNNFSLIKCFEIGHYFFFVKEIVYQFILIKFKL